MGDTSTWTDESSTSSDEPVMSRGPATDRKYCTAQAIQPRLPIVRTRRVEASALSSTFDSLRSLSATGLLTEYDVLLEPLTPNRSIQLFHGQGISPLVRFTSSPVGTVIAANMDIFLYDDRPGQNAHRLLWSENIGRLLLDVSSDNTTGHLYVLHVNEINIYQLDKRGITLVVGVPLRQRDFGRIALGRDYLYITRECNGLVEKMNIRTHEISEIISGLTRPTAVTTNIPQKTSFAVADDHEVNIYSTNGNRRLTSVKVDTAIFDIEMIGDDIFVLTRNEIRRDKLIMI